MRTPIAVTIALLSLASTVVLAGGITSDQVDTFDDGTSAGWAEGGASPNPPTNIADGGPLGAGDNFLQNVSGGGGGPGSRQVMFNRAQWTGNYIAAGVRQIQFDARNIGNTEIRLRVAFQSANNTRWASTAAVILSAQGAWTPVLFELNASSMTMVSGIDDFQTAISNVVEFRILSAGAPSWTGDVIAGTLGVDNIFASTVPVELMQFSVE